ncbi:MULTISPECIES: M14 family metallopeptidase [unclassified Carboxylicivirga]|uniref:M14 family metallopeptidase n=1 Tax=Carboxylicivirga TaxID=1628153 RepID=UPI003D333D1A
MSIFISSTFDAGNIELISADNPNDIQLKIRKDTHSDFLQWFYFRVQGAKDKDCTFKLINAGEAAYPEGWDNYQARVSYDRETWFQAPTRFDGHTLYIEFTPECDTVYIAYFAPFSYEQHLDLINDAQQYANCRLSCIGQTIQGRPIDLLRIGDDDPAKKKLWVIARQHPGEAMAEWFMLGLIDRLLDEEDAVTQRLLQKANFYLVPNMNVDGSILGNLRVNAKGVNLNREWATPSVEKSPEVYYVKEKMLATGVDFVLDVHGDEGLPYNFISGIEGIPSFDARLQKLSDDFISNWMAINPDMQKEYGYPKNEPGQANLMVGSKNLGETFGCLSQTLEMPFKQNDDLPDELLGWSPQRSIKLGESLVPVLLRMVDDF